MFLIYYGSVKGRIMTNDYDNIAIGVDIEEIERFEKYSNDKDAPLLKRIYNDGELEYCFKTKFSAKRLAARYCAKEAVYKAMCNFGVKVVNLKEIEIYHDNIGVPQVRLLNGMNEEYKIKISLSHSQKTAIAQVIICKVKPKKKSIFRKVCNDGSLRFLIL